MPLSYDDFTRHFWAALLGSKVAKDGQVKGYSQYSGSYANVEEEIRRCWNLGGSQDDAIAAGVLRVKDAESRFVPSTPEPRASNTDVANVIAAVQSSLSAPPYRQPSQAEWDAERERQLEAVRRSQGEALDPS